MILTCPNCDTRYSVDGSKFPPQGRAVRCAKCGHTWHQPGEVGEQPSTPNMGTAAAPAPVPPPPEAPAAPFATAPAARAFAPSAARNEARPPLGPRLAVAAGWLGLIAVVLLIAVSAVRYRQDVAAIWPQSAAIYSSMGLPVNASGIDFRQVDYQREIEDGAVVLVVSGRIVNIGPRELPVPQIIRVTLSDVNNRELYHWTFAPKVATLKPGQSAPFLTRLSSPPAAARHLEVRFAKDPG